MPKAHVLPDNVSIEVGADETILQASLRAGIEHTHACGGNARCSTCRVLILNGAEHCTPRTPKESALVEQLNFDMRIRLACQTKISGPITLRRLVLDELDLSLADQRMSAAVHGPIGHEKEVVVLFADICGFVALTQALPAYDVVHILNRYFGAMGRIIERHGGLVTGCVGDGLMAIFGHDECNDAGIRAIRAGLEMLDAVDGAFGEYVRSIHKEGISIGIGAHFGRAVIGNVGSDATRQLTAIGDAVNTASRVEAATRELKARFLITDALHALVADRIRVLPCRTTELKGKLEPYCLFEVVGL